MMLLRIGAITSQIRTRQNSFNIPTAGFDNGQVTDSRLFGRFIQSAASAGKSKDAKLILESKHIDTKIVTVKLFISADYRISSTTLASETAQACGKSISQIIHVKVEAVNINNTWLVQFENVKPDTNYILVRSVIFFMYKPVLDGLLDAFAKQRINLVDIIPLQALRLEALGQIKSESTIIDIHDHSTYLTHIADYQIISIKRLNIGTQALSSLIAQNLRVLDGDRLRLNYASAIQLDHDWHEWSEVQTKDNKMLCINKSQVVEISADYARFLLGRIKNIGLRGEILLIGDAMPNLAAYFEENLSKPVVQPELPDILDLVTIPEQGLMPYLKKLWHSIWN